jgi:hypothetical protein
MAQAFGDAVIQHYAFVGHGQLNNRGAAAVVFATTNAAEFAVPTEAPRFGIMVDSNTGGFTREGFGGYTTGRAFVYGETDLVTVAAPAGSDLLAAGTLVHILSEQINGNNEIAHANTGNTPGGQTTLMSGYDIRDIRAAVNANQRFSLPEAGVNRTQTYAGAVVGYSEGNSITLTAGTGTMTTSLRSATYNMIIVAPTGNSNAAANAPLLWGTAGNEVAIGLRRGGLSQPNYSTYIGSGNIRAIVTTSHGGAAVAVTLVIFGTYERDGFRVGDIDWRTARPTDPITPPVTGEPTGLARLTPSGTGNIIVPNHGVAIERNLSVSLTPDHELMPERWSIEWTMISHSVGNVSLSTTSGWSTVVSTTDSVTAGRTVVSAQLKNGSGANIGNPVTFNLDVGRFALATAAGNLTHVITASEPDLAPHYDIAIELVGDTFNAIPTSTDLTAWLSGLGDLGTLVAHPAAAVNAGDTRMTLRVTGAPNTAWPGAINFSNIGAQTALGTSLTPTWVTQRRYDITFAAANPLSGFSLAKGTSAGETILHSTADAGNGHEFRYSVGTTPSITINAGVVATNSAQNLGTGANTSAVTLTAGEMVITGHSPDDFITIVRVNSTTQRVVDRVTMQITAALIGE